MTTLSKLNLYGASFQTKVVGALLTQRQFLLNIFDALETEYFENQSHQWIVKKIMDYYNQYHTNPTVEVLSVEVKKVENEILKIAITETLREAYKVADERDIEWVEKEFTNFCKNQQVKKAIMNSVDLLNAGDFDSIRRLINQALKAGEEKNTGLDYNLDIEARYRNDDRNPIPFPWPVFNELTQGGAGKGDLVLVFGNPGGGKSWAVTAMGAYAASLGYNVVHYSLELGEGYVGKRYDSIFSGIDVDKLSLHRSEVEEAVKRVKGKVIIKEYPPKRASFDTINSHLDQLKNYYDIDIHMVIIDYLDYMRTSPKKERKEEIDDVYIGAKSFAKERGIPVVSPSQANRSAAKNDIIEGDNAAGSYEKIMIGDILISLARKRKDKVNGTGKWHFMKNRYGPDGLTFLSKINTSNGKIEINDNPLLEEDEEIIEKKSKNINDFSSIDLDDKNLLKQKFFSLHIEEDKE